VSSFLAVASLSDASCLANVQILHGSLGYAGCRRFSAAKAQSGGGFLAMARFLIFPFHER
jgi:hypothetical protein